MTFVPTTIELTIDSPHFTRPVKPHASRTHAFDLVLTLTRKHEFTGNNLTHNTAEVLRPHHFTEHITKINIQQLPLSCRALREACICQHNLLNCTCTSMLVIRQDNNIIRFIEIVIRFICNVMRFITKIWISSNSAYSKLDSPASLNSSCRANWIPLSFVTIEMVVWSICVS